MVTRVFFTSTFAISEKTARLFPKLLPYGAANASLPATLITEFNRDIRLMYVKHWRTVDLDMTPKSERFELRLDPEIIDRIDNWRSERSDLPSRSEAVRRLIEAGLGHPEDEQLFELTRFNVLVASKTEGPRDALSGAYVYAWDNGVYPLFQEGAHLHRPFAAHFQVTEEMISELSKYLDAQWLKKRVPTFYELEDYYDVRSGRSVWDRISLIRSCRYIFLNELFDRKFWSALLKGSDHPTEAKCITDKFENSEVYLN